MSETTQPVAAGMPCPRCRVDLIMSDRQGIEIDYCPKCRDVWLNRGELVKIIERDAQFSAQAAPPSQPAPSPWTAPDGLPPQGWARATTRISQADITTGTGGVSSSAATAPSSAGCSTDDGQARIEQRPP